MSKSHEIVLPFAASFGSDRVVFRGPTLVDQNIDKIHTTLEDLHNAISIATKRNDTHDKYHRAIRAQFPRDLFARDQMLFLFKPTVIFSVETTSDPQNFIIPVSNDVGNLPVVAIGLKDKTGPYAYTDDLGSLIVSCNVSVLNSAQKKRMTASEFTRLRDKRSFGFTDKANFGISFRVGEKGPPILSVIYNADASLPIDIAVNPQALRMVLQQGQV